MERLFFWTGGGEPERPEGSTGGGNLTCPKVMPVVKAVIRTSNRSHDGEYLWWEGAHHSQSARRRESRR